MKILLINKFLHPNGGSETYIFRLGDQLKALGHQVQYFGMDHPDRCVGNDVGAYTRNMDFHGGSALAKLSYPVTTIYSSHARRQLRRVLEDFRPDVCHINNFNYQLTPSILLEIQAWRSRGHRCRMVFTAHDYQLVCPNHMCRNPITNRNCEKCLGGHFTHCLGGRCIHGSRAKSAIGMAEAFFWKWQGAYRYLDTMVCCSAFLKSKMDTNPLFAGKTVTLHNFVDSVPTVDIPRGDYVLYFGRYSEEKGIAALLAACRALPDVHFIFAGSGPLAGELRDLPNVENVGFQTGAALQRYIAGARFSVYPSEWYENCPFSVMESQILGTPVLGAQIGGIPELIQPGKTGMLFESGNVPALIQSIRTLWDDRALTDRLSMGCRQQQFDTAARYAEKILKIYANE